MMDLDYRIQEWRTAAHNLGKCNSYLVVYTEGLGLLDRKLIEDDESFLKKVTKASQSFIPADDIIYNKGPFANDADKNLERQIQSHLWVLGVYEVVRTIAQHATQNPTLFDEQATNKINDVKVEFSRLRIPLAKLEAQKKYVNKGDYGIAFPRWCHKNGFAWEVAPDTIISRRKLSDIFLELLKSV